MCLRWDEHFCLNTVFAFQHSLRSRHNPPSIQRQGTLTLLFVMGVWGMGDRMVERLLMQGSWKENLTKYDPKPLPAPEQWQCSSTIMRDSVRHPQPVLMKKWWISFEIFNLRIVRNNNIFFTLNRFKTDQQIMLCGYTVCSGSQEKRDATLLRPFALPCDQITAFPTYRESIGSDYVWTLSDASWMQSTLQTSRIYIHSSCFAWSLRAEGLISVSFWNSTAEIWRLMPPTVAVFLLAFWLPVAVFFLKSDHPYGIPRKHRLIEPEVPE